jgi:tetratricopeptide (TPR) repeat protein
MNTGQEPPPASARVDPTEPRSGVGPPAGPGWISVDALELATSLSLAARIEPPLVRQFRVVLHPAMTAAAEYELWFSPSVAVRGANGLMFEEGALAGLRQRLTLRSPTHLASLRRVRLLLSALRDEQSASPYLRLEEEITAAALDQADPVAAERSLARALAALLQPRQPALGRQVALWAARALPRLPSRAISGSSVGWLLAQGASVRLGGAPILPMEPPPGESLAPPGSDAVRWLRYVLPDRYPTVQIGIRADAGSLELVEPCPPDFHRMTAPLADPVLVEIRAGVRGGTIPSADGARTLVLARGSSLRVPAQGVSWVRTADGPWHVFDPPGASDAAPPAPATSHPDSGGADGPGTADPDGSARHRGTGDEYETSARDGVGARPYVGLRPFRGRDRHRFFGREEDARRVAELWLTHGLLIVYGPSGVGRTSLLHAGVLPRLAAGHADVLPIGRLSPPIGSSGASSQPSNPGHRSLSFSLLSSWAPEADPRDLHALSVEDFLRSRAPRSDDQGQLLPILAAIDGVEQLFTEPTDRQRRWEAFFGQLQQAARAVPQLRLLLSITDKSLPRLLPFEARLTTRGRTRYALRPLNSAEALAAVVRPLVGSGRRFGSGVAEHLVAGLDAASDQRPRPAGSVDPTALQLTCATMWQTLPPATTVIARENLPARRDVESRLFDACATAVDQVAAETAVSVAELWHWLADSFVTAGGSRAVVDEDVSQTAGQPLSVARAFVHRDLLHQEIRFGGRWFELAHDRLIGAVRRGAELTRAPTQARPTSAAATLRTAENAYASGDLAAAEAFAASALRGGTNDHRTSAEAQMLLGMVCSRQGDLANAEEHYRSAIELFALLGDEGSVGQAQGGLGRVLLATDQFAAAAAALQAATRRVHGDADLQLDLVRALWRTGRTGAAGAILGQVLTVAPGHVEALVLRGCLRAETGLATWALHDLDEAVRIQPSAASRPEVVRARGMARGAISTPEPG